MRGKSLIEFPPTIAYGNLYFANSLGTLFAVKITRVRAEWAFRTGRCTAASPAVAEKTVYMAFLNKPPCNATRSGIDGEVVALDANTGKVRWKVTMGPTESSPLVAGGLVYVGDWSGKLYALNARTGRVVWTYQTGDKIKDGYGEHQLKAVFVGDSGAVRFVRDGLFPWNPSRRAELVDVRQLGDVVLLRYALSSRFEEA